MPLSEGWDAARAIRNCPIIAWDGRAWRMHKRKYAATDAGGSRKVSGRYNRGLDLFPENEVWTALYLALSAEICLGEVVRHITPELLPQLNGYRLSELAVQLTAVLDCRDVTVLSLHTADLWHDTDYSLPRLVAEAAIGLGAEGMLVPSATRLGGNLIVFPEQLRATASLIVVAERDPALYAPRS